MTWLFQWLGTQRLLVLAGGYGGGIVANVESMEWFFSWTETTDFLQLRTHMVELEHLALQH